MNFEDVLLARSHLRKRVGWDSITIRSLEQVCNRSYLNKSLVAESACMRTLAGMSHAVVHVGLLMVELLLAKVAS